MRPEQRSKTLLGITRSKAKMYEYGVPEQYHIRIPRDPSRLFTLVIGMLGDLVVQINSGQSDTAQFGELQENLRFSAYFFDAYCESKLNQSLDPYLLLLGSASYYLCDLPGSSGVLAGRLGSECPNLDCLGLEKLMMWLLQGNFLSHPEGPDGQFGKHIKEISYWLAHFYQDGIGEENLFASAEELRKTAYASGSPRQLLFADVICALARKRHGNSTWYSLPLYSGLPTSEWFQTLQKESFIRELWPAQHLLGKHGVFRGTSAVVQMPTSAGKTRSTEIIIRSAFLSGRTSLAIIVAPFRALCHEIRNSLVKAFHNESVNVDELSDVLQTDFEINELLARQQILVVTPEKLVYVLRHAPEMGGKIGLLIYDEGHQFDNGTRGVTYELLLTSLKGMVPDTVQTVLISAVISNADSINDWLNGGDSQVVLGTNLGPTYRNVAFASWIDQLGRLEFVTQDDPDKREFFVPRIIESYQLQIKKGERKKRVFPEKGDGQSVALYLGLKLTPNGSVALFCGTRRTATGLCEKVIDAYNRGLPIAKPIDFSVQDEVHRLCFLYECNLGRDATATQSARLGIFTHHGNTPHGIRLAVEHAMKERLARFVICTSTLAQGVNLPIRYLIVTNIYQGTERIKVRDFHNLIGRAGRSGMHTEGSILFANSEVYDGRNVSDKKWRWTQVKNLLEQGNSEPCTSALLSIFDPLHSDDHRYTIPMEPLDFAQTYVENPSQIDDFPAETAAQHADKGFTKVGLEEQIAQKINIIAAIESYLMAHWDDSGVGMQEDNVAELARGTLAYHLAEEEKRDHLIELFKLLAKNIGKRVSEANRRKVFGKTLYGVRDSIAVENWVNQNIEQIEACGTQEDLFALLWPVLAQNIRNSTFRRCNPSEVLKDLALGWIEGRPFHELFTILTEANVRFGAGEKAHHPQIEHVVDICENALAYDGMLAVGAVTEVFGLLRPNAETVLDNLWKLQKRLKYGLPSSLPITIYELGFADRVVSMELSSTVELSTARRKSVIREISKNKKEIKKMLKKYPTYFSNVLDNILPLRT